MTLPNRARLFEDGRSAVLRWCITNNIVPPTVVESEEPTMFGTCAYYRSGHIYIHVPACAAPVPVGRIWSYPGYTVDRTPFGVLAHELGHHVDGAHGAAGGKLAHLWVTETGEEPISGYCPNNNEWFAEMFRVFVTNPDLLRALRPHTFTLMRERWKPIESRTWQEVLGDGNRWHAAASRKVVQAAKKQQIRMPVGAGTPTIQLRDGDTR